MCDLTVHHLPLRPGRVSATIGFDWLHNSLAVDVFVARPIRRQKALKLRCDHKAVFRAGLGVRENLFADPSKLPEAPATYNLIYSWLDSHHRQFFLTFSGSAFTILSCLSMLHSFFFISRFIFVWLPMFDFSCNGNKFAFLPSLAQHFLSTSAFFWVIHYIIFLRFLG